MLAHTFHWDDFEADYGTPTPIAMISALRSEIDRLEGLVRTFCLSSEEASLRSIEARNPGIDMDDVRKQRGRVDVEAIIRG